MDRIGMTFVYTTLRLASREMHRIGVTYATVEYLGGERSVRVVSRRSPFKPFGERVE
jgi:hypothetical protein